MPKKLFFSLILYTLTFILSTSPALAATLSLSPTSGTFGRSCSFSTQVLLDTQGVETDGADVILLFDPSLVTASSIINGPIYSDFPGSTIDNSAGKVSVFALAPSTKGFTGKGTVATINFTTTATASASQANIKFDFDPTNLTKTTDSNVIRRSDLKEVLSGVTNGSFTINPSSTGCSATKTVTTANTGATTLPDSGIWEPTLIVGGLGVLMVSFSMIGFRKSK